MRILFTTEYREQHYTIQAVEMLKGLNDVEDIRIDFFNKESQAYDVILFMGYDPEVSQARAAYPDARIGVIDPRRVTEDIIQADFIVTQGIEETNWFSDYALDICRYDIYPIPHGFPKKHSDKETIIIGYHGNKVHLRTMCATLSPAIETLAEKYQVEFWAIYNIRQLGKLEWNIFPSGRVTLREIQWEWNIFEEYFPAIDIGVIPNLIPIHHIQTAKKNIESFPHLFHEHDTDNLIRFKGTSNIARLYPFAIFGIPVVADFFPSALQTIEDGVTGFIGGNPGMWYRALERLADSAALRQEIAEKMYEQYRLTATPEVFNRNFATFLREILQRPPRKAPPLFASARERLHALPPIHEALSPKKNPPTQAKRTQELLKRLKGKWL